MRIKIAWYRFAYLSLRRIRQGRMKRIPSLPRDSLSCPKDILPFPRDFLGLPKNILHCPRDSQQGTMCVLH